MSVEAEAAIAFQTLHERLLSFQCWTVADSVANCDACLQAYSRLLCARHVPCLAPAPAADGDQCSSKLRCSAPALPCPSVCQDAVRLCPFNVLEGMACPSNPSSLLQGPAPDSGPRTSVQGRAATGAEVEARPAPAVWGAGGCFLGWGGLG